MNGAARWQQGSRPIDAWKVMGVLNSVTPRCDCVGRLRASGGIRTCRGRLICTLLSALDDFAATLLVTLHVDGNTSSESDGQAAAWMALV